MLRNSYKKILCAGCFIFYCGSAIGNNSLNFNEFLEDEHIASTIKDVDLFVKITLRRALLAEKSNSIYYRDINAGIKEAETLIEKSRNISIAKIKLMKKTNPYYSCNFYTISSYVSFIADDFKKIKSCKTNSCNKEDYDLINSTLYTKLITLVKTISFCEK